MKDMKQIVKKIYSCLFVLSRNDIYEGLRDKYLKKHLLSIPLKTLIMFWKNEKNMITKEKMETLVAKKILSMDMLFMNNPDILEEYLPTIREISSIDAVTTLIGSKNDTIFEIVHQKYCEIFDDNLENDARLERIFLLKEID